MRQKRRVELIFAACTILLMPIDGIGSDAAQDLPATFTARVLIVNAPKTGAARLKLTIERWTTDEERATLLAALREGGNDALASAMHKLEAGHIQVDTNLRWPIRVASSWPTEDGRLVRVATNRPIHFGEYWRKRGTRTTDYPIGVIEFTLPADGSGEGALLAATRIGFDDQGRIEIRSLPRNTGPQQLVDVTRAAPKKSKKKKKEQD